MIKPTPCSNKPLLLVLLILASVTSSAQEPPKNRLTPQQLRVVQYNGLLAPFLATLADQYAIVIGFEMGCKYHP
jgi:hypothetical protein